MHIGHESVPIESGFMPGPLIANESTNVDEVRLEIQTKKFSENRITGNLS